MIKNHKGFTILEAIASVFIITLVLTTAMTIILTMRNHARRTEEKINATDVGSLIRFDLEKNYSYENIEAWLNGNQEMITYENCESSLISCDVFDHQANNLDYSSLITITFLAQSAQAIEYRIIHFEIEIVYYKEQSVTLVGVIYA